MVHMVDHLDQVMISKYCGHYAFEKESLVVEEEMKRSIMFFTHSCLRFPCGMGSQCPFNVSVLPSHPMISGLSDNEK